MEKEVDNKNENLVNNKIDSLESEENTVNSVSSESEGQNKDEIKKKQNKQLIWAIILMVSVIAIIIAVPYLRNNYFNKFNSNGMIFQKTMFNGQIPFYTTKLPLYTESSNSNNSITTGLIIKEPQRKQTGSYVLNLRQDPRTLNDIIVDLNIYNITFIGSKTVYATYNSSDPTCPHNIISAVDLAQFLINFGALKVDGAVMNKDYADANKISYVTCDSNPGNTVIMTVTGNESRIFKVKENCYELMYANCDIQSVTNKFILIIAEDYTNTIVKKS